MENREKQSKQFKIVALLSVVTSVFFTLIDIALSKLNTREGYMTLKVTLAVLAYMGNTPGYIIAGLVSLYQLSFLQWKDTVLAIEIENFKPLVRKGPRPSTQLFLGCLTLGWAIIDLTIAYSLPADAACITEQNYTVCTVAVGSPIQFNGQTYVVNQKMNYNIQTDSINSIGSIWSTVHGSRVRGSVNCAAAGTTVNEGYTTNRAARFSVENIGTLTSGYVPKFTCSGQGNGFNINLGLTKGPGQFLPFAKMISGSIGYTHTWVTVDCPAQRVLMENTPMWADVYVEIASLNQKWLLSNLLTTTTYIVCNIETSQCTELSDSVGSVANCYINYDGTVSNSQTLMTVAWIEITNNGNTVINTEVICDVDANCYNADLLGDSCPIVIQPTKVSTLEQMSVFTDAIPYKVINGQFMQSDLPAMTAICVDPTSSNALTSSGSGMQPMFFENNGLDQQSCLEGSLSPLAGAVPGTCSFTAGNLLTCTGTPSGVVTLRTTQEKVLRCLTSHEEMIGPCMCTISECGRLCNCTENPTAPTPLLSNGEYWTELPDNMCETVPIKWNRTMFTLTSSIDCYLSGQLINGPNYDYTISLRAPGSGTWVQFSNRTIYFVAYNYTSQIGYDNISTNTSTNVVYPPQIRIPRCTWECKGEILCMICEREKSSWCIESRAAISYDSNCNDATWEEKLEVTLLRILIYVSLIVFSVSLVLCLIKRSKRS